MSASFSIFDVHRIEVSAHSTHISDGRRMHYQRLELFDADGWRIGEIILHFERPMSALAIGDCSELDGFTSALPLLPPPAPALHLTNQVSGF